MIKMTKARIDGLFYTLLGSLMFLIVGVYLVRYFPSPMADFRALYYPARCLIEHRDPYSAREVLRVYQASGGDSPSDTATVRQIATLNVYPPTAISLSAPFALLPWGPAHILWMILSAGSVILAAFLILDLGANYAPAFSGILLCFLLINSVCLLGAGNVCGIAISFCVIAVWCFFRERFIPAGVLFLAISLAVKPHDTGLVWLYFLLAGGLYRKRALQTLLVMVILTLPALLWVWQISPHWMQELPINIVVFSAHGGVNDPGPASTGGHGLDMIINLQAVFSVFKDDPRFYNLASYLVCAPLVVLWGFVTLRSSPSPKNVWLALAAIAPLTLLPVYHRLLDTELLLLTIPACAVLRSEGGVIGRLALIVNFTAFVLTGAIPWALFLQFLNTLHLPHTWIFQQLVSAVQTFPAPLAMLVLGTFYLWVYYLHRNSDLIPEMP